MPTSTSAAPLRIARTAARETSFGDSVPGSSTAPIDEIGVGDGRIESIGVVAEIATWRRGAPVVRKRLRERCEPRGPAREDRHAAAEAGGDPRRFAADVARADDDDARRRDVVDAGDQRSVAAAALVCSACAPTIGASRPAMRDIGASSGSPPRTSRTVS